MNMKLVKKGLIAGMLLVTCALQAQVFVAVVEFQGKGVSDVEASALTDRLILELFQTGKFRVMEREMLDRIVEEQVFQLSGCSSTECLVQIGELAGVEQIVSGSVSKVGSVFSISARLISVSTGEILDVAVFDYEGNLGQLLKSGMANVARQLTEDKPAEPEASEIAAADETSNPAAASTRPEPQPIHDTQDADSAEPFLALSPYLNLTVSDLTVASFGGQIAYRLTDRSVIGFDVGYGGGSTYDPSLEESFDSFNIYLTYEYLLSRRLGFEVASGFHGGYYDSYNPTTFLMEEYDYSGIGLRAGFKTHFPAAASPLGMSPQANIEISIGDEFYIELNLGVTADLRFLF